MKKEIQDSYTRKLRDLMELRDQLKLDKLLISEGRYVIGENGIYQIFHNDGQRELIRQCEKFSAEKMEEKLSEVYSREDVMQKASEPVRQIEQFLIVIEYEIELIHYKRQILWQNENHTGDGKEDPKKRKRRMVLYHVSGLVVCIAIGLTVYFVSARLLESGTVDVWTIRILLTGAAITVFGLVTRWIAKWKDKK